MTEQDRRASQLQVDLSEVRPKLRYRATQLDRALLRGEDFRKMYRWLDETAQAVNDVRDMLGKHYRREEA